MVKREGHTHTQFCPHGSGDDAELMIQKAIKMGFQEYSMTEHAPLPPKFAQSFSGTPEGLTTAAISMDQVQPYLDFARQMQTKYRDQIKINVGFEVDFLPGFEDWTKAFLDQFGPQTQDNILSVHFMQGSDRNFWCVDYTTEDFAAGFKELLQDPQSLYQQFFKLELLASQSDLGKYKPTRYGHLTLIRKYQDYYNLPRAFSAENIDLIRRILTNIKDERSQLDLNTAGLYKEFCNEIYPGQLIVQMAQAMGIELVFGSDAHSVLEVGHGYHAIEDLVN